MAGPDIPRVVAEAWESVQLLCFHGSCPLRIDHGTEAVELLSYIEKNLGGSEPTREIQKLF
jgi:hypothetical protein